jgi:hypothetical protein
MTSKTHKTDKGEQNMPHYIIAYHGGRPPESPEEGAAHKVKWGAWIGGLGEAAINPGTPLGMSTMINAEGVLEEGGPEPMSGFSIVAADDLDAALAIAKSCPFLDIGGTLEVAQVMNMK